MIFIPEPLRPLLGAAGATLDETSIERLLAVAESDTLDFKREPHGNGDSQRRDLAADVASFANHKGGLVIVGVAEGPDGGAATLSPLQPEELDREELRVRQTVATFAAPIPLFDVVRVTQENRGYLIISVPPSTSQPHAVVVSEGLRYPVRHGAGKRYLSESEVAERYRNRFAVAAGQVAVLGERHSELVRVLDRGDKAWVSVALQPDRAGVTPYTRDFARNLEGWISTRAHQFPGWHAPSHYAVRGGFRSFRFRDHEPDPYLVFGTLYRDGGGTIAHGWPYRPDSNAETEARVRLSDEDLVASLINSVTLLVSWAVEQAGLSGDAAVIAQVHAGELPTDLWQYRAMFRDTLRGSAPLVADSPVAETTLNLPSVVSCGTDLLLAVRVLAEDLLAGFEFIEPYQIDTEGRLRKRYFYRDRMERVQRWADERGADATDEA